MARHFLTLARRHGADSPDVLALPGVSFEEQLRDYKAIAAGGKVHPEYAEIELWQSDAGIIKRTKFQAPKGEALKAPPVPSRKPAKTPAKPTQKKRSEPEKEPEKPPVDPENPPAENEQTQPPAENQQTTSETAPQDPPPSDPPKTEPTA